MKLTISCQTCGKILMIAEKDNFSDEDISMYKQSSSCDTLVIENAIDEDGNVINIYDGTANVIATKTQV